MSFILIAPNMNLPAPAVGVELGPDYAFDINNCLTLIDRHDHTPGNGVQITPAGMNINTTLPFNDNPITTLAYLNFQAQGSASTVLDTLSVAPASSIDELFYTDSNGTSTQITKNGTVNVIASSIPGESYVAGTFIWTQTQSSLPTTPANFDIGSIILRPNTASTTNGVTLIPPSTVATSFTYPNYNVTLTGTLPSTLPSVLKIDSSGNTSPIASGTNGQQLSLISGQPQWVNAPSTPTQQTFTSGTGTYTTPTGCRAISIRLVGGGAGGGGTGLTAGTAATDGGTTTFSTFSAQGGLHGTNGTGTFPTGVGGQPQFYSSANITIQGAAGGSSGAYVNPNTSNITALLNGGYGGNSVFGGGGQAGSAGTGGNGTAPGSGGGGAGPNNGVAGFGGGGGASGSFIQQLILAPAPTYSYSVGTGGNHGVGTVHNGGDGHAGIIIVDEYY